MFQYLKLMADGIFRPEFWKGRWDTFREVVTAPRAYFARIGDPAADEGAYLLGLTVGLVNSVAVGLTMGRHMRMPPQAAGAEAGPTGTFAAMLPIVLMAMLATWLIGAVVTYYVMGWVYSLAVKWVVGPYEPAKVRPILFAAYITALASLIPYAGGIVSMALMAVLLVVAFEAVFNATRRQAVLASLLGLCLMVLLGYVLTVLIVHGLPMILKAPAPPAG